MLIKTVQKTESITERIFAETKTVKKKKKLCHGIAVKVLLESVFLYNLYNFYDYEKIFRLEVLLNITFIQHRYIKHQK